MWTSAIRLDGVPDAHKLELCGIINSAIRADSPSLIPHVVVVAHGLNTLCVVRTAAPETLQYPPDGRCFRGGGFDERHRGFFTVGKKYRVPGFLATSFSEAKANEFLYNSHVFQNRPAIKWIIHLDVRGATDFAHRCKHVNLVKRTNVPGEWEFLFAGIYECFYMWTYLYAYASAQCSRGRSWLRVCHSNMSLCFEWIFDAGYSTFEVLSTEWNAGTDTHPHVVQIQAAVDNRFEDEDLPLAPWY
jgi:hypothetical protein